MSAAPTTLSKPDVGILRVPQVHGCSGLRNAESRRRGRPSIYTQELAVELCLRVACGESLRAVSRDPAMPAMTTLCRWLSENRHGFRDQYARAREVQAELLADEMIELADSAEGLYFTDPHGVRRIDPAAVRALELQIQSRRWTAERLLPRKYGPLIRHGDDTSGRPAIFTVQGL